MSLCQKKTIPPHLSVEKVTEAPPGDDLRVAVVEAAAADRHVLPVDTLGAGGDADDSQVGHGLVPRHDDAGDHLPPATTGYYSSTIELTVL